jgi:hypothetical protein
MQAIRDTQQRLNREASEDKEYNSNKSVGLPSSRSHKVLDFTIKDLKHQPNDEIGNDIEEQKSNNNIILGGQIRKLSRKL